MQQFCFVLNCQDVQSTRNCIIYNHLNLSWKFLDVNLKMYDEAHTFSKLFWGNVQIKQCGTSWLSTGPVLGEKPKLAVQLMGCPGPWEEERATNSRYLVHQYMLVKQMNISAFSFSLCFLSPAWSWKICLPRQCYSPFWDPWRKKCQVSRGHVIPERAQRQP